MSTTQIKLSTYALGVEELSLALGMINRPDLARSLLHDIYPDITDHQMKARLMSASNSLLACNLCTLSEGTTPRISQELQMAIFPLAFYDYVLQLGLITRTDSKKIMIHVQRGKRFSMHSSRQGVIHLLEHGNINVLLDKLMQYIPQYGRGEVGSEQGKVPQELIEKAGMNQDANDLEALLLQQGWKEKLAREFSIDLTKSALLASFVRLDANSQMTVDETRQSRTHSLIYLQGKKHNWLMEPSTDGSELGDAYQVSSQSFRNALSTLLE